MEKLIKIISAENGESEIPKWQINEVRKRTENYLKNPNNANDIDDFLKEIESDLNLFK
ncbi:hypothetical protein [Flavobacterium panici]|uniref:Uncharacterized protein n=1 Tax=Flavobacterium panici TaxID=2654843 RepID=A0A9N8P347_9FLAO|nr:hypothetical protein [Flavobacterium panici]CAC9975739.1 hypothetical protein FLAPXU55_03455 [Flavobacterium panici]